MKVKKILSSLDEDKRNNLLMIISTALMGIIAVCTAWSGFQSTKWSGEMSISYAAANATRSNSVEAALTANQQALLDVQLFVDWVNAKRDDDEELAQFYFERMRDEAKPAIEAWLATDPLNSPDAPASPFEMPEYVLENQIKSDNLEQEANDLSEQAQEANQRGDNYVATAVILASGLFFAGIATRLRFYFGLTMVILAAGAMAYGIYNLVTYPVLV